MRLAILLLLFVGPADNLSAAVKHSCAERGNTASYLHVRGRLSVYNGGYPNLRLWEIGTHHLFGVYGDSADLKCNREGCNAVGDEDTKLPANLDKLMMLPNPLFEFSIYGEFEIRPLEPLRRGHMQAVCIVDAKDLVRRRDK